MKLREKCALVIGASSGMGAATARRLARRGYRVAMVARREEDLKILAGQINARAGAEVAFQFCHDVKNADEVPGLFDSIVETLGGLSLVIYASGAMPKVEEDEYDFEKDRTMVEVNVLGMIAWLNQAASLFSRLQAGTIVGIGSIAGDRGRSGQPVYNTTKGAQAIYLEALRNRLASRNVRVVTIKPGFVDTAMTAGMGDLLWMISADEAARQIVQAAHRSRGTVYVPRRWGLVSWVIIHMPSFLFRRLGI